MLLCSNVCSVETGLSEVLLPSGTCGSKDYSFLMRNCCNMFVMGLVMTVRCMSWIKTVYRLQQEGLFDLKAFEVTRN